MIGFQGQQSYQRGFRQQSQSTLEQSQRDHDGINLTDQLVQNQKGGLASREMFASEVDASILHQSRADAAGNRPTMATGMLEDNSSIQDGHPEFELIGSDFVPSQKAGKPLTSADQFTGTGADENDRQSHLKQHKLAKAADFDRK